MQQVRHFLKNSITIGLLLISLSLSSTRLQAQSPARVGNARFVRFSQTTDSSSAQTPLIVAAANPPQNTTSGSGLVINAIFDPSIDAATQSVITSAIAF